MYLEIVNAVNIKMTFNSFDTAQKRSSSHKWLIDKYEIYTRKKLIMYEVHTISFQTFFRMGI